MHAEPVHPVPMLKERNGPSDFGSLLACGSAGGHDQATSERGVTDGDGLAGRRLAFMAEASAPLAGSLDYETTLRNVARLTVPLLADWCVVDTLDEDGSVRLLAAAHVDPSREDLVRELRRWYPPDPHARYGLRRVLDTGRPDGMLACWHEKYVGHAPSRLRS